MSPKLSGISFVVPAYNESKSVLGTLERLWTALSGLGLPFEIILVNDGSKDDTLAQVATFPHPLSVISHPINIGYGNSLKTGIKAANFEVIGIVDADGTYDIECLPQLVAEMEKGYDLVVAGRPNTSEFDGLSKRLFRWVFKKVLRVLVNKRIDDPNSGFRLFKRDKILQIFPFLCGTFSFTTTMTIFFFNMDWFVSYLSIPYHERTGHSKVKHFRDSILTLLMIVQGITFFNPIKFFFILMALVVVVIFIPAMGLAMLNMHTLSLYYLVFGALLSILIGIGVLGDIVRISIEKLINKDYPQKGR